jgi:ParB family chromosome partitioning protein
MNAGTMTDPKDRKRGLGRGLGALMPTPSAAPTAAPAAPERQKTYFQAQIEDVYPNPEQPRRRFDDAELDELAGSIRAHGVIMPLVVRPRRGGGYELIAGERRWRAAQRAGLREVQVVVQDVDDREAFERALVENLQRADLNAIEEASAYQRLIEMHDLTQDEVAHRVGKDRSTIANSVRLLRLPPSVRQLVEERRLSMGHARALLSLDDEEAIEVAARRVLAKGLSVRATEALVKASEAAPDPRPARTARTKSASVKDLEERLTRALGGPVTVEEDPVGADGVQRGSLTIRYLDLDHLDQLLDRLLD